MMKNVITSLFVGTLLSSSVAFGQELNVIATSGDHAEGGGYSLSWTMGEVIIPTLNFPDNDVTQGFHQPNVHVLSVNGVEDQTEISVYPNPTSDLLNISTSEECLVELKDAQGKLIEIYNVNALTSSIDVSMYERGTYLLVFHKNGATIKQLKVVVL